MIKRNRKEIITVLLLMAVAAFLSISQIRKDNVITNDGCSYAKTGQNIADGKGYTYMDDPNIVFPPVYPYLIATTIKLTGLSSEKSGILVSILAWIITIIPIYLTTRFLFKGKYWPTALTTFLITTNMFLNGIARRVQAESVYLCLLAWSVLLVIYLIHIKDSKKHFHFILIGAAFGITVLARPEAFVFIVLISMYILLLRRKEFLLNLKLVALLLLTFYVIASPYMLYLKKHTGHFLLSGRAGITMVHGEKVWEDNFLIHHEKRLYSITKDKTGIPMYRGLEFSNLKYMINNPDSMITRIFFNIKLFFLALLRLFFPIGLILLAFIFFPSGEFNRKIALFIPVLLVPIFANMLFRFVERHLFQYLLFVLILFGLGLYRFGSYLMERRSMKPKLVIPALFVLVLFLHSSVFIYYLNPAQVSDRPWHEHKEMGLWMKDHLPEMNDKVVVSRKALTPFYAGAVYKALPWVENRFELFHYLDNVHADYLIVDTRYFKYLRPTIEYLLDTDRKWKPLELVKIIENEKQKIVLYKFKGYS